MKQLVWVGSSRKDLTKFPDDVIDEIGHALDQAQQRSRHSSAKTLSGFGGAGVVEVVADDDGDTYRAVYTVRHAEAVYVLHVFQKKSKQGIATPQRDMELIRKRLRDVEAYRRGQGP